MTPTTEQLKDLLAKVTPDWWVSHVHDENGWYGSAVFAGEAEIIWFEDNYEQDQDYATLIALAPALADEVVQLRSALGLIADMCDDPVMRTVARQALDATSAK